MKIFIGIQLTFLYFGIGILIVRIMNKIDEKMYGESLDSDDSIGFVVCWPLILVMLLFFGFCNIIKYLIDLKPKGK